MTLSKKNSKSKSKKSSSKKVTPTEREETLLSYYTPTQIEKAVNKAREYFGNISYYRLLKYSVLFLGLGKVYKQNEDNLDFAWQHKLDYINNFKNIKPKEYVSKYKNAENLRDIRYLTEDIWDDLFIIQDNNIGRMPEAKYKRIFSRINEIPNAIITDPKVLKYLQQDPVWVRNQNRVKRKTWYGIDELKPRWSRR